MRPPAETMLLARALAYAVTGAGVGLAVLAGGGHPSTGAGWPTYYMQDHYTFGGLMQNIVSSMVFEGVFEQFPDLKIVSVDKLGY